MRKQLKKVSFCVLRFCFFISITTELSAQTHTETTDTTESKLDIKIITIPFKIRPSVDGFPMQLNTNFSTALYLGNKKDMLNSRYGYGLLLGIGAVTMSPYVTQQKITEEYEGFVSSLGFAGLYDTGRLNLGLAAGIDHLMDKNKQKWIYQHKIWFGVLFGINLN